MIALPLPAIAAYLGRRTQIRAAAVQADKVTIPRFCMLVVTPRYVTVAPQIEVVTCHLGSTAAHCRPGAQLADRRRLRRLRLTARASRHSVARGPRLR